MSAMAFTVPNSLLALKQPMHTPVTFTLSSTASYVTLFLPSELTFTLKPCRNTTVGPDGAHYQMLHHHPAFSLMVVLAFLITFDWLNIFLPLQWPEAHTLPFFRAKRIWYPPSGLLALTSCVCKLLKHMINFHPMWYLESKRHLFPPRFGFWHARGRVESLLPAYTYITSAFA